MPFDSAHKFSAAYFEGKGNLYFRRARFR
jgi:hypothetical protein